MPTPKTDELQKRQAEAYNANSTAIKENAEQTAAEAKSNGEAYVAKLKTNQNALKNVRESANSAIAAANAQTAGYFADLVKKRAEEIKKAEGENKALSEAERKAAAWAGATELASSVVNLIGVAGFNATPQTYHSYSQDWMKKADANLKERRSRIDNIRERQRAAEMKLVTARDSTAKNIAELRYKAAVDEAAQMDKFAEAEYKGKTDALKIQSEGNIKAAESNLNAALAEIKLGAEEIKRQDSKDALNKRLAASDKNTSGKLIKVTFGASGDLPEETMTINPQALYNTILANKDSLGLTREEEKELAIAAGDATGDALAKALVSFATANPKLRALVRKSADSTTYIEPGNIETEESAEAVESAEEDEDTGLSKFNNK